MCISWDTMKKLPFFTICLFVALILSLHIPMTNASGPSIELDENYYVEENRAITLKAVGTGVKRWNWGILEESYSSKQVIGEAALANDLSNSTTLYAPVISDDTTWREYVQIKVLARGHDGEYTYRETRVYIINTLRARPGGPYRVFEGQSVTLDGDNSSGKAKNYNWGIVNSNSSVSLSRDLTPEPVFHSNVDVDGNKEIKVVLELTGGGGGRRNYDRAYTTVEIVDTDLQVNAEDNTVLEGSSVYLTASYTGYVKNYRWSIEEDPTGEASLENERTSRPILHAPKTVENRTRIVVELSGINKFEKDSDNAIVTVLPVYSRDPENQLVSGKSRPKDLNTLSPTLSAIYKNKNKFDKAKKAEIIILNEKKEEIWRQKKDIDIKNGNRLKINYSSLLSPNNSYRWKIRFKDKSGWGPWSESKFRTGGLLSLKRKEAKEFLSSFSISIKNRTSAMERALESNPSETIQIVKEVKPECLARVLVEMTNFSSSPRHAAKILEELPENKAVITVRAMIGYKSVEELDKIFLREELSEKRVKLIYSSLLQEEKKILKENLSSESLSRVKSGGYFSIIFPIFVVIIGMVLALIYRRKVSNVLGLRSGKEERWDNLIREFLNSGKEQMVINSELPPTKELNEANRAIERSGKQDKIKLGRRENEICLIKEEENDRIF